MNIYLEIWDNKNKNKYNRTFPCFILENNGWDDYRYKTLFQLYFCEKTYNKEYIGDVKILCRDHNKTIDKLTQKIIQLDERFCSLGQSLDYYRNLSEINEPYKTKLLIALNDVVYSKDCYENGKSMSGFSASLLRNSEAQRIVDNRDMVLKNVDFEGNTQFVFTFKTKLQDADKEHELKVDFSKKSLLPNRLFALIGKNATGKTQVLSRLAESIVVDSSNGSFDQKPRFSKIIAVSYSVFDEFYNPREMKKSFGIDVKDESSSLNYIHNYIYCGIRDGERILAINDIKHKLSDSMKRIKKIDDRLKKWKDILVEIIEPQNQYIIEEIENGNYDFIMSSGQHILVSSITEIIANIESESLIIFDEPEVHLHPNAISNLMRMLNTLLKKFNSYAILSTHSPLIIQEIPAHYVRVFERSGNTTSIKYPLNESFGENVSSIIDDIFRVENYESNFKACLKEMYRVLGHEGVLNLFENKLSFNSLTYLNVLQYEENNRNYSED